MRRRDFITLLGAATWPFAAAAQQTTKLPTIGYLGAGSETGWSTWTAAFVQRMSELGWIDGRTVAIEYRWAEGRGERFSEISAEFVRLKVDVIVTVGSAVLAAMHATSTIPIVFGIAVDPVGTGMVASLARPGGNVTGLSVQNTELPGKRIELLRQLFPNLSRWLLSPTQAMPALWRRSAKFGRSPARWELTLMFSKSGKPRISRPPSARSRAGCRSSMCARTR
jgi:putative tryptophan/tyrosine transport system substrate-binding protein